MAHIIGVGVATPPLIVRQEGARAFTLAHFRRHMRNIDRLALGVTNGHLLPSYEILRCYENMSSPTVVFVLDYVLRHSKPVSGDYGLMAALGPGFSAEQVLIRC